jgi:plasmid stabilization system protein ParE
VALKIKWNKKAIAQLDAAIQFIENDSIISAEKVKKDILLNIDALTKHPEKYNTDKYKTQNDATYRAFEIHQYRIAYRYKTTEIRIIRIRHTKMNPSKY